MSVDHSTCVPWLRSSVSSDCHQCLLWTTPDSRGHHSPISHDALLTGSFLICSYGVKHQAQAFSSTLPSCWFRCSSVACSTLFLLLSGTTLIQEYPRSVQQLQTYCIAWFMKRVLLGILFVYLPGQCKDYYSHDTSQAGNSSVSP